MIFRFASRGIFMIKLAHHLPPTRPQGNIKTRKKNHLFSVVHPVSPLVPVCYLDTRNILLNPTALPKQGGVTYPLQLFDIHV